MKKLKIMIFNYSNFSSTDTKWQVIPLKCWENFLQDGVSCQFVKFCSRFDPIYTGLWGRREGGLHILSWEKPSSHQPIIFRTLILMIISLQVCFSYQNECFKWNLLYCTLWFNFTSPKFWVSDFNLMDFISDLSKFGILIFEYFFKNVFL